MSFFQGNTSPILPKTNSSDCGQFLYGQKDSSNSSYITEKLCSTSKTEKPKNTKTSGNIVTKRALQKNDLSGFVIIFIMFIFLVLSVCAACCNEEGFKRTAARNAFRVCSSAPHLCEDCHVVHQDNPPPYESIEMFTCAPHLVESDPPAYESIYPDRQGVTTFITTNA